MAEEIGSKPIDVQTLENIDSFDDLPDVTELTEEQLYAIRSGDLSSDYIAPFEWDGTSYEKWRSIIDGQAITEIPDSEDLHAHYDFSEYDTSQTSNLEDLSGNGRVLNEGSISGYGEINGVQAAQFDGDSDELFGPTFDSLEESSVFAVVEVDSDGFDDRMVVVNTTQSDNEQIRWWGDDNEWQNIAVNIVSGTDNIDANLIGATHSSDGRITIREDGTETGSDDGGKDAFDAIGIGSRSPNVASRFFMGKIGEVLVYPDDSSDRLGEVESYLSDKWGVSLS